jgi:uncharacterized protein (DUF2461 family)
MMPSTPAAAFEGFKSAASKFFKELADNQNAAWFEAHKAE